MCTKQPTAKLKLTLNWYKSKKRILSIAYIEYNDVLHLLLGVLMLVVNLVPIIFKEVKKLVIYI